MDTVLPEWSLAGMSTDQSCVRPRIYGRMSRENDKPSLKKSLGHPTRHSKMINYSTTSERTGKTQINSSLKGQTEAGS